MGGLRGYTLTELLVIVTIVGLAAGAALPALDPVDATKVDLVAQELADAIRYARSEAQRSGTPRHVLQEDAAARIRVFRETGGTPVFDVYHPVDKHLYDRRFGQAPFSFSGTIATTATFRGACNDPSTVAFDANGAAWCTDPADVLVDRFTLTVALDEYAATVELDGLTGRVWRP